MRFLSLTGADHCIGAFTSLLGLPHSPSLGKSPQQGHCQRPSASLISSCSLPVETPFGSLPRLMAAISKPCVLLFGWQWPAGSSTHPQWGCHGTRQHSAWGSRLHRQWGGSKAKSPAFGKTEIFCVHLCSCWFYRFECCWPVFISLLPFKKCLVI